MQRIDSGGNVYFKKYIASINIDKLQQKIANFKSINYSYLTDDEIISYFVDIFGPEFVFAPTEKLVSPKDFLFFRLRIKNNDFPIDHECEYWNPPITNAGRVNFKGDVVLYAAMDPGLTIKEMNIEPGMKFSISVFRLKDSIRMGTVGLKQYDDFKFDNNHDKKAFKIIDQFIADTICRTNGDDIYRMTTLVISHLFGLLDNEAFAYPSVKEPSGMQYNVCFNAKGIDKLELLFCHHFTLHNDRLHGRTMLKPDGNSYMSSVENEEEYQSFKNIVKNYLDSLSHLDS